MIVFVGCVGQVSIAKMFLGGIGPGILLGIAYMILCYVYALKNDIPLSSEGFSWKRVEKALIAVGREELEDILQKEGQADLHCHFCNTDYHFDREDLLRLLGN